jgi:hypothetical protein
MVAAFDTVDPDWRTIVVDYLITEGPTVALRASDADADEARGTNEDYDAYDAWLDLPAGDDLCDEYEDGKSPTS